MSVALNKRAKLGVSGWKFARRQDEFFIDLALNQRHARVIPYRRLVVGHAKLVHCWGRGELGINCIDRILTTSGLCKDGYRNIR